MRTRIHIALNVRDLARSVDFYRRLLGVDPRKLRADYAKFESPRPALNLALNRVSGRTEAPANGAGLSHLGIEIGSRRELEAASERLAAAGLALRPEEGTTCCYAVQDKVWVTDPDGNAWELFVVLADANERGTGGAAATAGATAEGCCSAKS